jgi:hypothetical protein
MRLRGSLLVDPKAQVSRGFALVYWHCCKFQASSAKFFAEAEYQRFLHAINA